MKITEITVSYEATQSLSDYSNVRPGIRLTANLTESDDPVIARQILLTEARTIVYGEIDNCLIADGKAPRYYAGPRYQVMCNTELGVIAILPNEMKIGDLPGRWVHEGPRKMRLDQARNVAQAFADGFGDTGRQYRLIDCYDGDLSRLPKLVPEGQPSSRPEPDPLGYPDGDEFDEEEDEA